jgi:hypothetical protein
MGCSLAESGGGHGGRRWTLRACSRTAASCMKSTWRAEGEGWSGAVDRNAPACVPSSVPGRCEWTTVAPAVVAAGGRRRRPDLERCAFGGYRLRVAHEAASSPHRLTAR